MRPPVRHWLVLVVPQCAHWRDTGEERPAAGLEGPASQAGRASRNGGDDAPHPPPPPPPTARAVPPEIIGGSTASGGWGQSLDAMEVGGEPAGGARVPCGRPSIGDPSRRVGVGASSPLGVTGEELPMTPLPPPPPPRPGGVAQPQMSLGSLSSAAAVVAARGGNAMEGRQRAAEGDELLVAPTPQSTQRTTCGERPEDGNAPSPAPLRGRARWSIAWRSVSSPESGIEGRKVGDRAGGGGARLAHAQRRRRWRRDKTAGARCG